MKERGKRKLKSIGRSIRIKAKVAGAAFFMAGLIYIAALKRSFSDEE